MPQKVCSKCGHPKDLGEFYTNSSKRDGHGYHCRSCHKAYRDQHYLANKGDYVDRAVKRRAQRRAFIRSLKERPCADCGQTFPPCVMDFDHLPDAEKLFNISSNHALDVSKACLLNEVSKCVVVCANCHRLRTYRRRGPDQDDLEVESP